MPNEDKTDIPGAWRNVVHPRRHGMTAVEPAWRVQRPATGDPLGTDPVTARSQLTSPTAWRWLWGQGSWVAEVRHRGRSLLITVSAY